jgi:hypothetical protein
MVALLGATTLSWGDLLTGVGTNRTAIVVPLDQKACWQDYAYLAAVPAGAKANDGKPVVVALDQYATLRPEFEDFIRRYKPDSVYLVDALSKSVPSEVGLTAHWRLDKGFAGFHPDETGRYNAEVKQATVWKDLSGGAYGFDGRKVMVDDGSVPGSGQSLTVAFWVKPDALANQRVIGKFINVDRAPGWAVMLRKDNGKPSIRFRVGGGDSAWHQSDVTADGAYAVGEWVHVACTFAEGMSKIYLNGNPKASRDTISWSTPNNISAPLKVGNDSGDGFTGMLDDIRIYHRVLNDVEIQQLPGGVGAAKEGLVGYWTLDEIVAGEARDIVGGNHLKVVGKLASEQGRVKNGIHLMGKDGFLRLGSGDGPQRPFTVRFDLLAKAAQDHCVLRKISSADFTSPWSFHVEGMDLIFRLGRGDAGRLTAKNVVSPANPMDICATFENSVANLYVDHTLVGTAKLQSDDRDWDHVSSVSSCAIDNLRLYGRALSVNELSAVDSPEEKRLLAHWSAEKSVETKGIAGLGRDGKSGAELRFNGINDYLACDTLPRGGKAMTISCWVKPDGPGCLISRFPYEAGEGPGWGLFLKKGQRRASFLAGSRHNRAHQVEAGVSEAYSPGKWVHLVCTFKDRRATIYIDGQRTIFAEGKAVDIGGAGSRLLFGCEQPGVDQFKGVIADVRVFDRALEDEEVLRLFGTAPRHTSGLKFAKLPAGSAEQAACALATKFWKSSETVVYCSDEDYGNALAASGLAARLRVPLLYAGRTGFSSESKDVLKRLGAEKLLHVGPEPGFAVGAIRVTDLADDRAIIHWMRDAGLPIGYLAAANPQDRTLVRAQKISLAAPLLAAGRNGLVARLDFKTEWKIPFKASRTVMEAARGLQKIDDGWVPGECAINAAKVQFVVTTNGASNKGRIRLADKTGTYSEPYRTADRIPVGDRFYTVCLAPKSGVGEAAVWLTWPGIPEIKDRLAEYFIAMGGYPEYLCILGGPDTIPQGIVRHDEQGSEDLVSDLPFANADDDPFIDIAQGRLIGEDVYSATLTAARGLVYDNLIEPTWATRCGAASWARQGQFNLQRAGFASVPPHSGIDGPLGEDSPFREVAAIVHNAHSWWRELGGFVLCESRITLAPLVIESGGCSTTTLDRDDQNRSVAARLLRNGAVCVAGNVRNGVAQQMLYRSEFWNAILQGQSTGEAHRHALNRALLSVLEKGQKTQGLDRYQLYIRSLYGDPAVKLHLPIAKAEASARTERNGSVVTVHAPATWKSVSAPPNKEWNCSHNLLYSFWGDGVGLEHWWSNTEHCDMSALYQTAEVRTAEKVIGVEQMDEVPKPLGWSGKFWINEHRDGTRSVFWRVKPVDVDIFSGKIISQLQQVRYRLLTETSPKR